MFGFFSTLKYFIWDKANIDLLFYNFFQESLSSHYDSFRYHKVCQDTNNLVANDLSSFYFHLVKDRLYCCNMKSVQRKSAVTAIWYIFTSLR